MNNKPLDIIYNKILKEREDLILNNPLEKNNIIDLEENQLNKYLEKRNKNNYLKDREKKKFLIPNNELKFFLILNNTKINLFHKNINHNEFIKFISITDNSLNLLVQYFKDSKNIIFLENTYFRIYYKEKLIYELKLNNYGVKETELFKNNYKENKIIKEFITFGKYEINNKNYNLNLNKNFEFILQKINNNYYFKHLIFYNKNIINKINNFNNI
jgi:hypothetical protein